MKTREKINCSLKFEKYFIAVYIDNNIIGEVSKEDASYLTRRSKDEVVMGRIIDLIGKSLNLNKYWYTSFTYELPFFIDRDGYFSFESWYNSI